MSLKYSKYDGARKCPIDDCSVVLKYCSLHWHLRNTHGQHQRAGNITGKKRTIPASASNLDQENKKSRASFLVLVTETAKPNSIEPPQEEIFECYEEQAVDETSSAEVVGAPKQNLIINATCTPRATLLQQEKEEISQCFEEPTVHEISVIPPDVSFTEVIVTSLKDAETQTLANTSTNDTLICEKNEVDSTKTIVQELLDCMLYKIEMEEGFNVRLYQIETQSKLELEALSSQNQILLQNVSKLSIEKARLDAELISIKNQADTDSSKLTRELFNLQEKLDHFSSQNATTLSNNQILFDAVQTITVAKNQADEDVKKYKANQDKMKKDLDQIQNERDNFSTENATIQKENQDLILNLEALKKEKETIVQEYASFKRNNEEKAFPARQNTEILGKNTHHKDKLDFEDDEISIIEETRKPVVHALGKSVFNHSYVPLKVNHQQEIGLPRTIRTTEKPPKHFFSARYGIDLADRCFPKSKPVYIDAANFMRQHANNKNKSINNHPPLLVHGVPELIERFKQLGVAAVQLIIRERYLGGYDNDCDDKLYLCHLKQKGHIHLVKGSDDDDGKLLELAVKNCGLVISNDMFDDFTTLNPFMAEFLSFSQVTFRTNKNDPYTHFYKRGKPEVEIFNLSDVVSLKQSEYDDLETIQRQTERTRDKLTIEYCNSSGHINIPPSPFESEKRRTGRNKSPSLLE